MGRVYAETLKQLEEEGLVSLQFAVREHLQNNCYPGVSSAFVPAACQAIRLCSDDAPYGLVNLPNGHTFRAVELVEALHLQAFVEEVL